MCDDLAWTMLASWMYTLGKIIAPIPVLSVPLRYSSKLVRRPVAVEPVLDLRILNQSIDPTLKVLVLGQIGPMDLGGLHLPLQHLHVKKNYICMSK
jgi:hypothetical protein